jgi:hypothetical protein
MRAPILDIPTLRLALSGLNIYLIPKLKSELMKNHESLFITALGRTPPLKSWSSVSKTIFSYIVSPLIPPTSSSLVM